METNNVDVDDTWLDYIIINLSYFIIELYREVMYKDSKDITVIYHALMHKFHNNSTLLSSINYIIDYIKTITNMTYLPDIQTLTTNIIQIYKYTNNSYLNNNKRVMLTNTYKNILSYSKGIHTKQNKIVYITHKVHHIYRKDMILRLVNRNITLKDVLLKNVTAKIIKWLYNKNKGLLVRVYTDKFEYMEEIDGDVMIECAYSINY